MKMMTTARQIEIIRDMFDSYVEPVASSFMCGEVPSTVFEIHRRGTRENDWLAFIRFLTTGSYTVAKVREKSRTWKLSRSKNIRRCHRFVTLAECGIAYAFCFLSDKSGYSQCFTFATPLLHLRYNTAISPFQVSLLLWV